MARSIPRRDDLLKRMRDANRFYLPVVLFQAVSCLVLIFFIDWRLLLNQPLVSAVAVAAIIMPAILPFLYIAAKKRKEVRHLREDTRFGQFDKHNLQQLYRETLQKLNLPDARLPLYITADRTLNAMAVRSGFGLLFKHLNGIYLHRQTLHMLTPAEVQDTIGHELGHYYAYYYKLHQFALIALLFSALLGLVAVQWVGMSNYLAIVVLALCPIVVGWLNNFAARDLSHTIEFLCDDFGAHVHGVEVSINALMKVGAASELYTAIVYESIASQRNSKLTASEIVESIERAIPFGHASSEEINVAVEKELKRLRQQGPSLAGFLKYAWNSDQEEEAKEELEMRFQSYRAMVAKPRLDWEALLDDPAVIQFPGQRLEFLIELIERFPDQPLFYDIAEDEASTHPPTRDRILYLWYNRAAIAGSPNPIAEMENRLK